MILYDPNCYTTCHETNNSKIRSIDSNDTHEHISFLPSWSLLPGSCLSSDTEVSQSSPSWIQVFSEPKHKVVAVATTDAMITMATAEFSDRIVVNFVTLAWSLYTFKNIQNTCQLLSKFLLLMALVCFNYCTSHLPAKQILGMLSCPILVYSVAETAIAAASIKDHQRWRGINQWSTG